MSGPRPERVSPYSAGDERVIGLRLPVLALLDDMLLFNNLVAGFLDIRGAVRCDVDVRHLVVGLLASHRALLNDFFLFHRSPPSGIRRPECRRLASAIR